MYQTAPPAREVVLLNKRDLASGLGKARGRRNTTSTSTDNNHAGAGIELLFAHFGGSGSDDLRSKNHLVWTRLYTIVTIGACSLIDQVMTL